MARPAAATDDRLLMLTIADKRFGIASSLVREVARLPRLAHVPHAPPALMGLANVRGAVTPILSLATLVDRVSGGERRIVIVDGGDPLGLAVDGISKLIEPAEAAEAGVEPLDLAALIARSTPAPAPRTGLRAGAVAQDSDADDAAASVPLVIFAIADQEFALPLAAVEEVLRYPERIAIVPQADDAVLGSMAVRGALLPLLSLPVLLGLPGAEAATARRRILVVRIRGRRVGLLVDAMRSIVRVGEGDIDAVPPVLARGGAEARIQAICRLEDGGRLVSILAAEQLLRDDIMARLAHGATEQQDMTVAADGQDGAEQFLLFRIGEDEFGLPIGAVEEVAALPAKLARLPRAPGFIKGVMNLRGDAIPVIDQAQRFGAPETAGRRRRVMIVRIGDLRAGFAVDAVSEVLSVPVDALRPAPDLGNAETRIFDRVASLSGAERIVLIVSARELLDRAEQDMLRAMARKGAAGPS